MASLENGRTCLAQQTEEPSVSSRGLWWAKNRISWSEDSAGGHCPERLSSQPGHRKDSSQGQLTVSLSVCLEDGTLEDPETNAPKSIFFAPYVSLFSLHYTLTNTLTLRETERGDGSFGDVIVFHLILCMHFIYCPIKFMFSLTLHNPPPLSFILDFHTEINPLFLHLYKCWIKMDKDLNGRSQTQKLPRGNLGDPWESA
jgi:hypothetical protein